MGGRKLGASKMHWVGIWIDCLIFKDNRRLSLICFKALKIWMPQPPCINHTFFLAFAINIWIDRLLVWKRLVIGRHLIEADIAYGHFYILLKFISIWIGDYNHHRKWTIFLKRIPFILSKINLNTPKALSAPSQQNRFYLKSLLKKHKGALASKWSTHWSNPKVQNHWSLRVSK